MQGWPVPMPSGGSSKQCMTDCSCGGMLTSDKCPTFPGCENCTHWELVPGHVVAEHPTGVVVVHLHPGESLHDAVRREAGVPRWMN